MKVEQDSYNEQLVLPFQSDISVFVKREDVLHSEISGNKFRKLKYNLAKAKELGYSKILTFGGAYSNHIAAVAAAGKYFDFETIGVIRGDELCANYMNNPTLNKAASDGMRFDFVSRTDYRLKNEAEFIAKLHEKYGRFFLIPEGGTNALAVRGCEEILTNEDADFDYLCCAVGTGGTISGILNASSNKQTVLGFPALKENFLEQEIALFSDRKNLQLMRDYHFGGYAKVTDGLIDFVREFNQTQPFLIEPIYTGKMFYGLYDLIKKGFFYENSKILVIHTGGLQGLKSNILNK